MSERDPQRRLVPPDPAMLPFAVGGTALWLLLGLVLLALRPTLVRGGNENWIGICFAGAALGVVGIAVMALHDRRRGSDRRPARARRPSPWRRRGPRAGGH